MTLIEARCEDGKSCEGSCSIECKCTVCGLYICDDCMESHGCEEEDKRPVA